jgi:alpha,alpha-trehalase
MKLPVVIDPQCYEAVLFDLDGVVTDMASIHAKAWATMFDDFLNVWGRHVGENHSPFSNDD